MTDGRLRILLMGDASSYHWNLAQGLRKLGHEVLVVSNCGGWKKTGCNIDSSRRWKNKLGGLELMARWNFGLKQQLTGFDAVAMSGVSYMDLKPERLKRIYDYLRLNNKAVFYTASTTDPNFVAECFNPSSELKYSEFRIFGKESPLSKRQPEFAAGWQSEPLWDLCRHIFNTSDGAISALYEYDVALHSALPDEKIAYGGIPIDVDAIQPLELPEKIGKVRLFLGRILGRFLIKGTDILEYAAKAVVEKYPDKAELVIVENKPYDEYLELMKSAHVVLDQIYSYTPATNALQAMAYGLNTVSGGEPEFYDFIGERHLHPVINVRPDYESVYRALEHTVLHPEEIRPRGLAGREFVLKHNDYRIVAGRVAEFWKKRIGIKMNGNG